MLKAIRKHLKSKKSTNFMQYMKISRKESNDNNWINFRHLDEIANELDANLYKRDCFEFITGNNLNNYNKHNNYYNYNNVGQRDKEIKVIKEFEAFEAIQLNHQHLHALHRFRRHRKRGISSDRDVVISFSPKVRLSIVNRRDFYYRFGKKEEEAIACFDFLNDIPICDTDSIYDSDSTDTEEHFRSTSLMSIHLKDDDLYDSSLDRNSQLSLSDSCVEYYDDSSD